MATISHPTIAGVAELARQVRGSTLKILDMAHPAQLTWSPPGTSNHILWHAGHAVWLQDALTIHPITGHSELPPGWASTFGQNSQPSTITRWPSDSEVRGHLELQLSRILQLLSERAEAIAENAERTPPRGGWPLVPGMIHGWHDEARHQGEMYLLHKLFRARSRVAGLS